MEFLLKQLNEINFIALLIGSFIYPAAYGLFLITRYGYRRFFVSDMLLGNDWYLYHYSVEKKKHKLLCHSLVIERGFRHRYNLKIYKKDTDTLLYTGNIISERHHYLFSLKSHFQNSKESILIRTKGLFYNREIGIQGIQIGVHFGDCIYTTASLISVKNDIDENGFLEEVKSLYSIAPEKYFIEL